MKEYYLNKLKNDLKIRRYSNTTIKRYIYVTNLFLNFSTINIENINNLNENDAIKFLNYLTVEKAYKSSSYNNVNSILKFFLEVTLEKDIGYKRLPNAKLNVVEKIIPNRDDILYIINNTKNTRYKCWFALAYGSGLRTCEIAKLKTEDIDSINMKIKVTGKGNKQRLTVLPKFTLNLLRQYCKEEGITKYSLREYLFPGKKEEYISESTIASSLTKVTKEINYNKKISMHSLRRSFATHLLRQGVNIQIVKELMGHNSLSTTSNYIKTVYLEKELKNPLDSESYETYNSRSNKKI